MSISDLRTGLEQAEHSIDAFVLVGGTLLWRCSDLLEQTNDRGLRKRIQFPLIDSPWLVSYLEEIGITHDQYVGRISRNSERAMRLGFDVRFHSHPISAWYVVLDGSLVFQKHIGIFTHTVPTAVRLQEAGTQFTIAFNTYWNSGFPGFTRPIGADPTSIDRDSLPPLSENQRRLRIFLSYSSTDKPQVRPVYQRLCESGFAPWFDEVNLLPGQDFDFEIDRAVKGSDVVVICLSSASTRRVGYLQKELRYALEVAERQPKGRIFLIPALLEQCDVPRSLAHLHYVRLFEESGFDSLVAALVSRTE